MAPDFGLFRMASFDDVPQAGAAADRAIGITEYRLISAPTWESATA
ncbi:MAG TPA: hypothetical protein VJQ78_01905 [Sphingobium sp.]|nr:hypothetical protein [Sphingobium sp.]